MICRTPGCGGPSRSPGGPTAGLAVTLGRLFVTTTDDELTAFAPAA